MIDVIFCHNIYQQLVGISNNILFGSSSMQNSMPTYVEIYVEPLQVMVKNVSLNGTVMEANILLFARAYKVLIRLGKPYEYPILGLCIGSKMVYFLLFCFSGFGLDDFNCYTLFLLKVEKYIQILPFNLLKKSLHKLNVVHIFTQSVGT